MKCIHSGSLEQRLFKMMKSWQVLAKPGKFLNGPESNNSTAVRTRQARQNLGALHVTVMVTIP
jgi:hypothetical protein